MMLVEYWLFIGKLIIGSQCEEPILNLECEIP
jgi:hypothetical protein